MHEEVLFEDTNGFEGFLLAFFHVLLVVGVAADEGTEPGC